MKQAKSWSSRIHHISLLCQVIDKSNDRPDYSKIFDDSPLFTKLAPENETIWRNYTYSSNGGEYILSVFIRKIVITKIFDDTETLLLDRTLNIAIHERNLMSQIVKEIKQLISVEDIRSYLVVNCGDITKHRRKKESLAPDWIGDGLTTFYLRAFDSRKTKSGIIRVSRHLTILYGLTDDLVIDVKNLIYEKILYSNQHATSKEVFDLLSALGNYVLPTEVSLYTHRVASKLAAFAVIVSVMYVGVDAIQSSLLSSYNFPKIGFFLLILYVTFGVLSFLSWKLLHKISEHYVK